MPFKMKGFVPHNMYKSERANTKKEHLDLKEKGYDHSPYKKKNKEGKEQGVDGKACWDGYRYAGTENGKDKCVPI